MSDQHVPDFYETLQVSPNADQETLERVYRHLAKRYHPDNSDSGNAERFTELVDAFRVLADPEQRAAYDAKYQQAREARWRIFDQESAVSDVVADRRIRMGILSALYTARRNDVERPGLGPIELERLLGCPEEHLRFHIWYLKENGWVQRLENGMLAITASGVDQVMESGGPAPSGLQLLNPGRAAGSGRQGGDAAA